MRVILDNEDLEFIAKLKQGLLGIRAYLRLHEMKKMTDEELIVRIRKVCEDTDSAILGLKRQGL